MSDADRSLLDLIESRNISIGVLGLGYVGLPLSLKLVAGGFDVYGFDIDEERVTRLKRGDSYVDDVSDDVLEDGLGRGFKPSDDPDTIHNCEVYVVAVPTDVWNGAPDLSAVESASETIAEQSGPGETLVVMTSTVHPGATREVVEPIVKNDRLNGSTHVAMVPERLDPGSEWTLSDIPIVVGADTDTSLDIATKLFDTIVTDVHPVDSTATAELTKTLENTYRMVNIALVNELALLSENTEADFWQAIEAASTKPFGFQAFYPGPGVGGHCIPVDPQFLTWHARDAGTELSVVEGANKVNLDMPSEVTDRVLSLLEDHNIDRSTAKIVALGATYKANVADVRNSPALEVISGLSDEVDVTVVEPYLDSVNIPAVETVNSIENLPFNLTAADLTLLLVDHDRIDVESVSRRATLVFDTRNVVPTENSAKVVILGDPEMGIQTRPGNPVKSSAPSEENRSQQRPTTED